MHPLLKSVAPKLEDVKLVAVVTSDAKVSSNTSLFAIVSCDMTPGAKAQIFMLDDRRGKTPAANEQFHGLTTEAWRANACPVDRCIVPLMDAFRGKTIVSYSSFSWLRPILSLTFDNLFADIFCDADGKPSRFLDATIAGSMQAAGNPPELLATLTGITDKSTAVDVEGVQTNLDRQLRAAKQYLTLNKLADHYGLLPQDLQIPLYLQQMVKLKRLTAFLAQAQ